ncbi:MAG: hypothetical protein AAF927_02310 [Bacteroidota bacterium]
MKKIRISLTLFLILSLGVSQNRCGLPAKIGDTNVLIQRIAYAFDNLIEEMQDAPEIVELLMTRMINDLKFIADETGTEIVHEAYSSLSQLNGEFHQRVVEIGGCFSRGMHSTLQDEVRKIKEKLLIQAESVPIKIPTICISSPLRIDLNLPPTLRTTLSVVGWKMDLNGKYDAFLKNRDGSSYAIGANISSPTVFRKTLELASVESLLSDYHAIEWYYNDSLISSTPIIQEFPPTLPPCEETTIEANPSITPITHIPPQINQVGDATFSRDTEVSIKVRFFHDKLHAWYQVYFRALEAEGYYRTGANFNNQVTSPDRTEVAGWSDRVIYYRAPAGFEIQSFRGQAKFDNEVQIVDIDTDVDEYLTSLGQYQVTAKGSKNQAGTETGVLVNPTHGPTVLIKNICN